jgi:DNA-binding response OmpR family regulator
MRGTIGTMNGVSRPHFAAHGVHLRAFIRHRGRVLSREQLLDEVWGPGTHLSDRVVDNHVVALRRKIERDAGRPQALISVRGLGYRFDG